MTRRVGTSFSYRTLTNTEGFTMELDLISSINSFPSHSVGIALLPHITFPVPDQLLHCIDSR